MRILVSGCSGLLGKNFIRMALNDGHIVNGLVRKIDSFNMLPRSQVFEWSHLDSVPAEAVESVDAVVHFAGLNIADKKWTLRQKHLLLESRVKGTRKIVEALGRIPQERRPKVLVSSSAVGYYGYSRNEILNENALPENDFLAQLCVEWEKEALAAEKLGIRVILLRTGIVLSKEGGVLSKMPPLKISNGGNWMSWIHIEDVCRAIFFSLNSKSLSGPINCVSPFPVQNSDFVKELAKARRINSFGFVPLPLLRFALGELSNAIVSNLKVKPQVLLDSGFEFKFANLSEALAEEYKGFEPNDSFFTTEQFLPLKPGQVFKFFSRAENLEILTPPWLHFKILSKSTSEIEKGTVIEYRLKIHGFPVHWRTLINEMNENESFKDVQLKGPYAKWHHVHKFNSVPGGCLLTDEIIYRIPTGFVGNFFIGGWISKDIQKIFKYRQDKILELLKLGEIA